MWPQGTTTDPAWSPRSFSRAAVTYTKRDDGLVQPWYGRVWLNPPWSNPGPWIDKILWFMRELPEYNEVMLLVRNDPSTAWWSVAWKHATAIAFLPERTRYHQVGESGEIEPCGTPTFTSVVFYFGHDARRFIETASAHGHGAIPLRNHSSRRRMTAMPRAKAKPLPGDVLGEMIRDTIAQYARAHPECTLGELVAMIPTEAGADLLMDLQVRDLWPEIGAPQLPSPRNGSNGHVATELSPERASQVQRIIEWIEKRKATEFKATEIMAVLGVSRQTALRALTHVPNLRLEGRAKKAKYVVTNARK